MIKQWVKRAMLAITGGVLSAFVMSPSTDASAQWCIAECPTCAKVCDTYDLSPFTYCHMTYGGGGGASVSCYYTCSSCE